ncbi:MAG: DNA adenine methylase [Rhodocyclaceae bacterium]|nr:DNA adenine methylase [Rhodocyclaceae bacterium]
MAVEERVPGHALMPPSVMRSASPLRYPGGKGSLSRFLTDLLDLNDLRGCAYYEPFAGGAGAALNLLCRDVVERVHINDADPRVHAFWTALLQENERFAERIFSVPLDISEWHRQNAICVDPSGREPFDLGFAAFYMNRCNRSGVLKGAGPIGGYEQQGKWRLDVRFNRETLAERITALGGLRERIQVTGLDAIDFLKQCLPAGRGRAKVFVYADPPYVVKGKRLYLNAYGAADHACFARYLGQQGVLPWLVSYDDAPLIRELYEKHQMSILPIRYSLQDKRAAQELLIAPHRLYLPVATRTARIAHLDCLSSGSHP